MPNVQRQATALPARVAAGKGAWIVVSEFTREGLGKYLPQVPTARAGMHLRFKGREVTVDDE